MSNLIEDIGRARENLRKREAEASEAGYTLKMCRAEALKARMALDELLDELVTGRSRYPIFERLERSGSPDLSGIERGSTNGTPGAPGLGSHDEHQRGPTSFPDPSPPYVPPPKRARKKPATGLMD